VDVGIVVEEIFWHEEYVTGSTIMIEKIFVKISQEVSHADRKSVMQVRSQTCRQEVRDAVEKLAMQSVMQKSARKKQHKFREGNTVKIQNTHQEEMEWVDMVTTKLVEWADKVVYNTGRKAVDMVYMMQMTESFIHQYEEYTGKVDCLRKEVFMVNLEILGAIVEVVGTVFNEMKCNMEEFAVQKGDINMIEDTDVGDMVIFKFGKRVVIKMEYNTAERQKKLTAEKGDTDIDLFEDIHMENVIIVKSVKVVKKVMIITEGEYNMAEFEKKLTVEEVYIKMSVEVVRTTIVEVVRTAITKEEYNTAERKKKLTVKKRNIVKFEGFHIRNVVIFKFE
jgi:hypothetical protein